MYEKQKDFLINYFIIRYFLNSIQKKMVLSGRQDIHLCLAAMFLLCAMQHSMTLTIKSGARLMTCLYLLTVNS